MVVPILWIDQELMRNGHFDLFLLCYPDLPWEFDPLRENPDNREDLFILYKKTLDSLNLPYSLINGQGDQRLKKAIKAVDQLLIDAGKDFP